METPCTTTYTNNDSLISPNYTYAASQGDRSFTAIKNKTWIEVVSSRKTAGSLAPWRLPQNTMSRHDSAHIEHLSYTAQIET